MFLSSLEVSHLKIIIPYRESTLRIRYYRFPLWENHQFRGITGGLPLNATAVNKSISYPDHDQT